MVDVAIIGCGIVGAAVAEKLAQYGLSLVILEKENDVAIGSTKANSAILHAGYDPEPGTLMAKLNVRGSFLAKILCQKYDVEYRQIGSLVLAFSPADRETLAVLYQRGVANGVDGLRVIDADELRRMEPNVSPKAVAALYAPTAAVVNPWDYCLALAQSAVENGATLLLNEKLNQVKKTEQGFNLYTEKQMIQARYVVNAAGLFADEIHNMVLPKSFTISPNRGEYFILNKTEGRQVNHVVFPCPSEKGKGVLVSPTFRHSLIVGPNSTTARDKTDIQCTAEGLAEVKQLALQSFPDINFSATIRQFAGLRATADRPDFIIERSGNWIDLAGIKSPGLSSAPAIAEMAADLLGQAGLILLPKEKVAGGRKVFRLGRLSSSEKDQAILANPAYGQVICRCETITRGEIEDTFLRPIPPVSVDGVRRRVGAGMGPCQGAYCGPRVRAILAEKLGILPEDVPGERKKPQGE